jgi:hypothetical protein
VRGETILKQFYDAVRLRDMAKARTYLDDNMTFAGLFETYPNANAYIAPTRSSCKSRCAW